MTKKIRHIVLFALLTMFVVGCTTPIDLPEKYVGERQLVICGLITSEQPVRIKLTKSVSMLEYNGSFPMVDGATVRLIVNGVTENLVQDTTGFYCSTMLAHAGDSVVVWASDGQDTAWVSAIMPSAVELTIDTVCEKREFLWTMQYRRDSLGNYVKDSAGQYIRDTMGWNLRLYYDAKVSFPDPANTKDAYIASAYHFYEFEDDDFSKPTDEQPKWNTVTYVSASNLLLSELGYDVTTTNFTSDTLRDGKVLSYTIKPYCLIDRTSIGLSGQVRHAYMVAKVYHTNHEYYRFLETANLSSYTGGTGFSSILGEPVKTYSNINGGLGVLGVQTLSVDTLVLY